MAHVRGVFGQDDVAGELTRGEPEGKVGDVVELEFGMNPGQRTMRTLPAVRLCEGVRPVTARKLHNAAFFSLD